MIRSNKRASHFIHGFVYDCQHTEPRDIFEHLQKVLSLDEEWIYATSSQYHSDVILSVDQNFRKNKVQSESPQEKCTFGNVHQFGGCVGDGDALVTNQRHILLCTRTADCVPILLYNSEQVAVVHAGWRGIANEILPKCCSMMSAVDGAIVGPCISQRNYEVDLDVIEAFERANLSREDVAQEYTNDREQQKFLLNVAISVEIQLKRSGLSKEQIEFVDECTFESDRFHSYRRDGKKAGRNWSCIGLL